MDPSACEHRHIVENDSTWIETCDDCGAWRDRTNAPAVSWAWRYPASSRIIAPRQAPDIGADVPGAGRSSA